VSLEPIAKAIASAATRDCYIHWVSQRHTMLIP